ncbi:MAG: putative 2-dehydropantoate 2-reductase [Desulfuromonadales bacterium]|nr:putative 2-dehydropantoate 2-reductase [Desulfuromonadales bacterium]
MRIGVIGAGALGLYYGALLQRAGHDLRFLLRRDYPAISSRGLTVTSPHGDFHLPEVAGFTDSRQIGPVDLVLVGLKSYDNDRLCSLVAPLVGAETAILTLQNGLGNEERLITEFGSDRVVGGVAFLCCNRGEPGTVHHLDQGAVRLAEFARADMARVAPLAELFRAAGIPCEACADLTRIRWEKLVWNMPFNGLCALTGLATDRLLACAATRQLIEALMAEVIAAANRQEISEPLASGELVPRLLQATERMGAYRPSMMIDRLERRPLELEAIYRIPLERGERQGAAMPRVAMLHAELLVTEPQAW